MIKNKHFYAAIATLIGTVIGAGVLGIPYAIAQAGFLNRLVITILNILNISDIILSLRTTDTRIN